MALMRLWFGSCLLTSCVAMAAQQKPVDPKDLPKITFVQPVGSAPGTKVKLSVRGLKLDSAKGLHFHEPKTFGRILKQSKVGVGNPKELPIVGDTLVEIELQLPPDVEGVLVPFAVENAVGKSPPYRLAVDRWPTVAEKEPNNGFRQAQVVQLPQAVEGCINQPLDVDMYRFEGRAGQRVVLEVFAARCGGPLDSVLTLYDSEGQALAANDDFDDTADSRIEAVLPKVGPYFASVIDAHEQGGPAHVYRLVLREKP